MTSVLLIPPNSPTLGPIHNVPSFYFLFVFGTCHVTHVFPHKLIPLENWEARGWGVCLVIRVSESFVLLVIPS